MTTESGEAPPGTLRVHAFTLQAECVVLRPMTEGDWGVLLRWNTDPEVLWFTEGDDVRSRTLEQVQRIYRGVSRAALCFIAEVAGVPVGEGWLQRMNLRRVLDEYPGKDVRRIDLAIGEKALWAQGLGTEMLRLLTGLAFTREGCDVLFGVDFGGHNPRSRRAFEKAGFRVLRTVPAPDSVKSAFTYDLVLTREEYARQQATAGAGA
jgi:RimJ/RimL family protein N-acetyltransferase